MTGNLITRLRRLEAAGDGDAQPKGVLVLPAGTAMFDPDVDRLAAEHRESTAWHGTLVVLPDSGRGAAP